MDMQTRVDLTEFERRSDGRWRGRIGILIAGIEDYDLMELVTRVLMFIKEVEGEGPADTD